MNIIPLKESLKITLDQNLEFFAKTQFSDIEYSITIGIDNDNKDFLIEIETFFKEILSIFK